MKVIFALWAIELIALVAAFIHHVAKGDFKTHQGEHE